ncbi:hypothetical protein A2U01_0116960 [Trifolium medium]|uniref:Uncharacterized protein n=1 Tax=Trifolium medium TaxID=97028 RepID=A0A392W7F4_9FABA|nr:hypothetical protein [Trifolium medium]
MAVPPQAAAPTVHTTNSPPQGSMSSAAATPLTISSQ